ncbi:MAG TPA: amino acid permease [Polyangium sp.]|nr:amino acid permease [Polyangium sp.]
MSTTEGLQGQDDAKQAKTIAEDIQTLHSLGYAQELLRRMSGFSNFAISFSIICILAGGLTSFALGFSSVGGASIGIGWPIGAIMSFCFAMAMAQLASAFPTAGGLYHWASILGGRGLGWVTAWFNLVGLVTVLSAINVGTYQFTLGAFGASLGIDAAKLDPTTAMIAQAVGVTLITVSQAIFNHRGIRVTTLLTDFSGYLIFVVSVVLTIALFMSAEHLDLSRLWTFTNYTGDRGGGVWPANGSMMYVFMLGLMLPAYTITGFDASAHTSEETVGASRSVPKAILQAVVSSAILGWLMVSAIVLAAPTMDAAAGQGFNVVFSIFEVLPKSLRMILLGGIVIAQYLCGLATVTSSSRMTYAFARDGGLPASNKLKSVSAKFRTPAVAIWVVAILSTIFTVYTPVYSTITAVCVIFLYISYMIPIALGLVAYGRTWNQMGPWSIGGAYRPVALICVLWCGALFYIGVQPPNDKALWITGGAILVTSIVWFAYERRHFVGPPRGVMSLEREAQIAAAEKAVGEG